MHYQVIPLIYAANEHFRNTIRFAIEFFEDIHPDALRHAVEQVQKRYPYFSVNILCKSCGPNVDKITRTVIHVYMWITVLSY